MRRQASRLELWVAIGSLVLIVLTRARTAAFATAVALAGVMLSRALSGRKFRQASLLRPLLLLSVAAVVLVGVGLATGKVSKFATDFAFKGTQHENHNLGAAFYDSRGGGVVMEWRHFLNRPLLGNGFGVYPDGTFPSGVTRFAGIPISAPIEKGFLPTAILEEGGLIGAASLALLILWLARRAWRGTDLRWRAMFVACLAINAGECVFLSPGGIGILDWLLMGVALSAYRALPQIAPVASLEPQHAPSQAGGGGGLPAPAPSG
jgi:O-antigen ligase